MMLTKKQQDIYEFIRLTFRTTGKMPTYRGMAAKFNMNLNAIYGHVGFIEKKGFLYRDQGKIHLSIRSSFSE